MPPAAATTVTTTQFEQRKSVLRHLDGFARGIVSGVTESLEAGGTSRRAQAETARATFTDEVARLKLHPGSIDYELAMNKFRRQLSRVVGGSVADGKSNTNGEIE